LNGGISSGPFGCVPSEESVLTGILCPYFRKIAFKTFKTTLELVVCKSEKTWR
jgi:hypothetical protein